MFPLPSFPFYSNDSRAQNWVGSCYRNLKLDLPHFDRGASPPLGHTEDAFMTCVLEPNRLFFPLYTWKQKFLSSKGTHARSHRREEPPRAAVVGTQRSHRLLSLRLLCLPQEGIRILSEILVGHGFLVHPWRRAFPWPRNPCISQEKARQILQFNFLMSKPWQVLVWGWIKFGLS